MAKMAFSQRAPAGLWVNRKALPVSLWFRFGRLEFYSRSHLAVHGASPNESQQRVLLRAV